MKNNTNKIQYKTKQNNTIQNGEGSYQKKPIAVADRCLDEQGAPQRAGARARFFLGILAPLGRRNGLVLFGCLQGVPGPRWSQGNECLIGSRFGDLVSNLLSEIIAETLEFDDATIHGDKKGVMSNVCAGLWTPSASCHHSAWIVASSNSADEEIPA